jgi:hypothetical protein
LQFKPETIMTNTIWFGRRAAQASTPSSPSPEKRIARTYSADAINENLRSHAVSVDWLYREEARFLHDWAARFIAEFQLALPTPAIRIDLLPICEFGVYCEGRNGLGVAHEITINARHIAHRARAEQLATLLHELLHGWQHLFGKSGRGNFHNRQFRQKARLYGLVINDRGHHLGVEPGRFTSLLAQHGINLDALRAPEDVLALGRPKGQSKLKKWTCPCGVNVRCAIQLKARCLKCGGDFEEAESAW